jgi:membrane-bound lytic murein transglycosylase
MDPVTISVALSAANTAFNAIKRGFEVGRDLEQMSGDVGRWMSAVSDVDNAEKLAKNPPLFGKLFKAGSVEEAALQAYAAKKKLDAQRQELKTFLNLTYGPQAYADLLAMEADIRKQRQQTVYRQQQLRRQVAEYIGWTVVSLLVGGFAILIASIWIKRAKADAKIYNAPKDYTYSQKVWQGKIKEQKYTTCRLKKRVTSKFTQKKACIYQGGNKTFTMMIESWCPIKYQCVYDPNGTEPDIDKVMESLRSIGNK